MLETGDVHIWTATQTTPPAPGAFETVLDAREMAAANRFHFERHRISYRFAHAALRHILGDYVGRAPQDIRFEPNSFGKPYLAAQEGQTPIHFNMSHSGDVVIVAVTRGRHIGVDVERIRVMKDFGLIAKSHFTAQERAFIESSPTGDQQNAFFKCWTRKEAIIKAVGKGLSIPLNIFDVFISPGQRGRGLPSPCDMPPVENWWLEDITVPPGYAGAVAVELSIERVMYKSWDPVLS